MSDERNKNINKEDIVNEEETKNDTEEVNESEKEKIDEEIVDKHDAAEVSDVNKETNSEKISDERTTEEDTEVTNEKDSKVKSKKKFSIINLAGIGLILLIFLAFAFIYTYTITKGNVSQNTLIIQEEIADTTNLLEMYQLTKDDRYVTLAYGNLKETNELLRQTLLEQSSIDFFFFPNSDYELLAYLGNKTAYLESVLQGQDVLTGAEVKELHLVLKTIEDETLPTTSINKFVKITDSIIEKLCVN